MSKAAAKKTTTTGKRPKSSTDLSGTTIALQFLDTTWRVAIPIVGLSYLGIRLDRHFDTEPLWALVGLFTSLTLAVYLVYRQIKTAYPDFYKKSGGNK